MGRAVHKQPAWCWRGRLPSRVFPMKSKTIRLSSLASMSKSERDRTLSRLANAASAPRNGQSADLDAKIRCYEEEYGFSSSEMRRRVRLGKLRDTSDVSRWLMLVQLRDC